MWMTGGVCEDSLHDTTGELAGSLIHLLNNIDGVTYADILAVRSRIRCGYWHFNTSEFYWDYIPAHACKWDSPRFLYLKHTTRKEVGVLRHGKGGSILLVMLLVILLCGSSLSLQG
jgi:hypothetical protein